MGKTIPYSSARLHEFASRVISSSERVNANKNYPKRSNPPFYNSEFFPKTQKTPKLRVDPGQLNLKLKMDKPEVRGQGQGQIRLPLAEVVSDCVKRWFQDTLKEARGGDTAMQVLVGQMYASGYGVHKDVEKGRAWIYKASRSRSSAWKVGHKQPGYNASDSDSDQGNANK